ncbi:MAG: serine/threonine-protein kinase [Chloroflexi bacterium]|nr:serine/threonine-protein kinase [Chloroflexota bacterium]
MDNNIKESGDFLETKPITQPLGSEPGGFLQLASGSILSNRYQVQDVIGIGGMGSVYRARDLHFPNVIKLVAVKEMINQAVDPIVRDTIVRNFEREANILVTLNHTSIPKIFDFFTHEDRSYLVLELINGKDLEAILRSSIEPVREDQAILWAIEVCDVLEYLHTHKPEPIIFRDIKPQNLMINQQNHIVMVDFGIAKIFKIGQKGTMIGTEGYSPPEQYRGEATFQTDIYALGATLHHILTRRDPRLEAPFSFNDRPIRKINANVSQELEAIVGTALNYKPEDRFKDISSMKTALISLAIRTGALSKVASGELISSDQNVKPLWVFKCEDEIRGSATIDSGYIYVGAYDNNLYALDAAKGQFQWKFPVDGGVISKPLIQMNQVLFGSEDGNIYSISSKSGKKNWIIETSGPIRSSAKIAEGHLFIGSDDSKFYAIDISSAKKIWEIKTEGPIRSTPFIQGDLIYFGNEANEFLCVDFKGQIKWKFRTKRSVTSSPVVSEGIVYFASLDANIYALDSKSGWVIWRFRMGKGSISSPVVEGNFVFVGSADGNLYCIEKASAKENWRFKIDHQVSGSPIIHKDAIYFGAADGTFYCLDQKTGRQRWKYSTAGPITSAPAANNEMVYIGSSDHSLYAFIA